MAGRLENRSGVITVNIYSIVAENNTGFLLSELTVRRESRPGPVPVHGNSGEIDSGNCLFSDNGLFFSGLAKCVVLTAQIIILTS